MLCELLKSPPATSFSQLPVLPALSVGLQSDVAAVLPLGDTVKHLPLSFALEIKQHVCLGCSKCNESQHYLQLHGRQNALLPTSC